MMRKREEERRMIIERIYSEERKRKIEEKRQIEQRNRLIEERKRILEQKKIDEERRMILEEVRRIDDERKRKNEEIIKHNEEYARKLQEEEYTKINSNNGDDDGKVNWRPQKKYTSEIKDPISEDTEDALPPIIEPEPCFDNSQSADSNDLLKFDDFSDTEPSTINVTVSKFTS